ncbi:MAG: hypothetical protein HeimC3_40140 [Candidatus Heimdallarchaeota archaeon LC_3]|nr:MAG: hypothetical protein HeimC3_40140 [Candidatus Heimdallarchaeota archaeon LC_3]
MLNELNVDEEMSNDIDINEIPSNKRVNSFNMSRRRFFIVNTAVYLLLLFLLFEYVIVISFITMLYLLIMGLFLNHIISKNKRLEIIRNKSFAKDPVTIQMIINKGGKK